MNDKNVSIDSLLPYPNHPFAPYEGKRMDDMVESIRDYGVISPIIARPAGGNKLEILSGHNRAEAAKRAGLAEIPAIVKEGLSDGEAALIVTESNLIQRSFADMKHSERAIALKNHLEALKRYNGQGKRNDLLNFLGDETYGQDAHKSSSRDEVAKRYALSEKTIRRYVRLAKLPKGLLDKADEGELKFIPAVELSWLSRNELEALTQLLESEGAKISVERAKRLRAESEKSGGKLTKEDMRGILIEETAQGKLRIMLPGEVSRRLSGYGVKSGKAIGDIINAYLDMLERGEARDVFGG
jgi:ParB family chromosome partitioning protein